MAVVYGDGDTSFQAAGGQAGIQCLVDCFYDYMESAPEAAAIRGMHPEDLAVTRDKLYCFLCGWLGGEKLFAPKYGPIMIPRAHEHLDIAEPERDAWLLCMEKAVAEQPYAEDFKAYLMRELFVPAERCRIVSQRRIEAEQASE
ncbi:globin [Gammaproteobacteria bacterium 53_120_T64]|nr:globin [Gammaproteobacteria bacterium 53_120_T64]